MNKKELIQEILENLDDKLQDKTEIQIIKIKKQIEEIFEPIKIIVNESLWYNIH